MPTYEYACRSCEHTFEIVRSMKDDSLTVCPECGGELRKVFAPPTITFRGSGFYATDHGKKAKSTSSPDTKDSGDTKESKPESKGEKKSEKKSDGGSATTSTTKKEDSS